MSRAIFGVRLLGSGALLALISFALCGCQLFGPAALNQGRDRYNRTIQTTAMEQTMSNIVRVYNHEPTLFMDVTEVDAAQSFGGSLSGGATSIGAQSGNRTSTAGTITGRLGNASGAVQYSESPTIRYVPLLGQALVAQLVSPVSVEALELLLDSYWPVAPVLDFSTSYLTLDKDEFYAALNPIIELDDSDALQFSASTSDWTKAKDSSSEGQLPVKSPSVNLQVTNKAAEPGTKDTLTMYLLPYHPHQLGREASPEDRPSNLQDEQRRVQLWARILRVYLGTQSQPEITCTHIWPSVGKAPSTSQPKQIATTRNAIAELLKKLDVEKDKIDHKARDASFKTYKNYVDQLLLTLDQNAGVYIVTDDDFTQTMACLRDWVELRTTLVPNKKATADNKTTAKPDNFGDAALANSGTHAPLMRTFSALGILKNATERPHPLVEFVNPETYRAIVGHAWNTDDIDTLSYYTLLPEEEDSIGCPPERKKTGCDNPGKNDATSAAVRDWIIASGSYLSEWQKDEDAYEKRCATKPDSQCDTDKAALKTRRRMLEAENYPGGLFVDEQKGADVLSNAYVQKNFRLGRLRRYILIIVDDHAPEAAYAPYYSDEDGKWFYIARNDPVSQKNFHLLSLFMTMMAIPSQTPPLTPTISVGGS